MSSTLSSNSATQPVRTALTSRQMWLVGGAIVLFALALRLIWAAPPRSVRWDEPDMLLLARSLLRGEGYRMFGLPELHWPPGPPLLAAGSMLAGVAADRALTVWHVIAGSLACGLLFGLAAEVTADWKVGLLAGLLTAVSASLAVWPLYWGSNSEMPFLALLLAGLWASWRLLHGGSWRSGLAGGLAFSGAYFMRPEGLFWWLLFLVIAAIMALRGKTRWTAVAAFGLSFVVLALPYLAYLRRVTGAFQLSGKTGITALLGPGIGDLGSAAGNDLGAALDSTGREIIWLSPEQFDISLMQSILADPVHAVYRMASNLLQAARSAVDPLVGPLLLGAAALGLFARPWDRRSLAANAFWIAALLPLLVTVPFHVEPRLLTPVVPVMLVWAAQGLLVVARWAQETARPWPRWRPVVVTLLALALVTGLAGGVWSQQRASLEGQDALFPSHREAGLWLAANSLPGEPVMTRDTEVGLYADRPLVALPDAAWDQVVDYGQTRGARYLVVDDWEVETLRPQLALLLSLDKLPPDVTLLTTTSDHRRTTYIFELAR